MKNKKRIILAVLLLNAVAYSQSSQTSKEQDSVKVSVKDMDKASFKMIERKEFSENYKFTSLALSVCDSSKKELRSQVLILRSDLADLKTINANVVKDAQSWKKTAENEKSVGLRRGFFGFLKGVGVTLSVWCVISIFN